MSETSTEQSAKPETPRPAAELGFDQSQVPAEQANQAPDAEPTAETAAGKTSE